MRLKATSFPLPLPFHSLYLSLFNLCLRFSEVFSFDSPVSGFLLVFPLLVLSFFRPPAAVGFVFFGKTCFQKAKQCTSCAQLEQIAEKVSAQICHSLSHFHITFIFFFFLYLFCLSPLFFNSSPFCLFLCQR